MSGKKDEVEEVEVVKKEPWIPYSSDASDVAEWVAMCLVVARNWDILLSVGTKFPTKTVPVAELFWCVIVILVLPLLKFDRIRTIIGLLLLIILALLGGADQNYGTNNLEQLLNKQTIQIILLWGIGLFLGPTLVGIGWGYKNRRG